MKIECDKCSAKYSIADEKVRGKTFKIRCKKCSNVIIVRDKAAAAGDAGGGAEPAAEQAAVGWHLAINGETVGPMPEDEVRQRYDAGEIDKDTAVWQEGYEDWIPLGDVDVFADLPDQPSAGGGDDPFASANQDDYAAAGLGAAAALGGAAAAAAASEPDSLRSPRVSSLTGQRNENSVLFSLDSLQQIASGGGGGAAPSASRPAASTGISARGLATAAPASEGSGLIDIRALGAMVGSEGAAASPGGPVSAPTIDDAALPSFGGAGLGGLASTPLVPAASAEPAMAMAAAAAPPPARSNAPLYVLMVLLIVAVAGLGALFFLREPEPVIVEKTVQVPPPTVAGAGKDEDKDKDEDEDEDKDKDDEDANADADKDDEDGDDEGAEGKDDKKPGRTRKGGTKSKTPPKKDDLPDLPDPAPTATKKDTSTPDKGGGDLDVDCILDPAKCGKGGTAKKKDQPKGASDPSLPEKLSTSDIKNGITPVKGAAKQCGSKFGAAPGTKVKVKISISGETGDVTSATAEPPHNGTPLGNCVAAALKKAKFKKFRKPSLGAVYPITL